MTSNLEFAALVDQLRNHPNVGRGWKVNGLLPLMDLRWLVVGTVRTLQQQFSVTWRHEKEQHVGGGYYSHEDRTSEWLNVPEIKIESE